MLCLLEGQRGPGDEALGAMRKEEEIRKHRGEEGGPEEGGQSCGASLARARIDFSAGCQGSPGGVRRGWALLQASEGEWLEGDREKQRALANREPWALQRTTSKSMCHCKLSKERERQ